MKKVLIIDDEEFIRQVFSEALTDEGYLVTAVPSGLDGLEAMKGQAFDLILVDKNMPGLDGIDFVAHARTVDVSVKIIMITGSVEAPSVPGLNGCLLKPIDIDTLLKTIQATLGTQPM